MISADIAAMNDTNRLRILKKIKQCDTGAELMDTSGIDHLLSRFDEKTFIFPTLSPLPGK